MKQPTAGHCLSEKIEVLYNNKNGDHFEIAIYVFLTVDLNTACVKAQATWLVSQRFR